MTLSFLPLPAQEVGYFMAQLFRHRLVDIKDAAIVDSCRQHHRHKGRHVEGLLVGAHLFHFLLEPCLHHLGLLPLELTVQADLLAVTIYLFFFCQVG